MSKNYRSPSQADRFFSCPGSVQAQEKVGIEQPSSEAAIEGTGIHAVAAHCLSNRIDARSLAGTVFSFDYGSGKERQQHTTLVNDDVIYTVNLYRNTILGLLREAGLPETILEVETYSECPDLPIGKGKFYGGTTDARCIIGTTLHIFDLKGGRGVIVSPEENRQCMSYAVPAVDQLGMFVDKVVLWIIQPRAKEGDYVKSWETTVKRIRDFKEEVRAAIAKTTEKNPEYKQGEWCGWCSAAGSCPVLQKGIMTTAQNAIPKLDRVFPVVKSLTPEQIGKALPALHLLKAYIECLEGYAFTLMKSGVDVPNYVLTRTKKHRAWRDESAIRDFLSKHLAPDEYLTTPTVMSPAKIEKLVDKKLLEPYIHVPEGDLKISLEKDATDHIKRTVDEVFKDVQFD